MKYEIVFTRSALKEILALPSIDAPVILEAIEQLGLDPRPVGVVKLKGHLNNYWRIRVGRYRVVYAIEDRVRILEIISIGHRKDIYRL
jgi:mRNA interferase RelE/StbE